MQASSFDGCLEFQHIHVCPRYATPSTIPKIPITNKSIPQLPLLRNHNLVPPSDDPHREPEELIWNLTVLYPPGNISKHVCFCKRRVTATVSARRFMLQGCQHAELLLRAPGDPASRISDVKHSLNVCASTIATLPLLYRETQY